MATRIREAFQAVPRAAFLEGAELLSAGMNAPVAIGHGQTNSQPSTVADMLTLLDLHPGQRVLDVGAGSGWTTALLAHLVGPTGQVIGVERVPELTGRATRALRAQGMPWARIEQARRGVLGWPEDAPYDRILVSAAPAELPSALPAQLALGGVLVIPVDGRMLRIIRLAEDVYETTEHGWYVFVPLVEDETPDAD